MFNWLELTSQPHEYWSLHREGDGTERLCLTQRPGDGILLLEIVSLQQEKYGVLLGKDRQEEICENAQCVEYQCFFVTNGSRTDCMQTMLGF